MLLFFRFGRGTYDLTRHIASKDSSLLVHWHFFRYAPFLLDLSLLIFCFLIFFFFDCLISTFIYIILIDMFL